MSPRLHSLFNVMNLAGLLAWAAIGSQLWSGHYHASSMAAADTLRPVLLGLHGAFLLLFALRQLLSPRPGAVRACVLAQMAVALALIALVPGSAAPVLLVIAMAQVPGVFPWPLAAALFVLVNAAVYAAVRSWWQVGEPAFSTLLNASFQLFAIAAAWYAVGAERSRDELALVNADLLATRSLLADRARDSERLRLSRELHDVAGHKLTALKLNLAVLRRDPAFAGHDELALCARLADELLGDIRALVRQMRLHDGVPLDQLIRRLAEPFPRPRLQLDMAPDLRVADVAQAEAVLRTVQEALTNAARHGGADTLWLRVAQAGDRLELELHDDGRGPAPAELRFGAGLTGMRERLEAVGGGVRAVRDPAGGVRLSAWLPTGATT
jgi:signal transduction histidine kinase